MAFLHSNRNLNLSGWLSWTLLRQSDAWKAERVEPSPVPEMSWQSQRWTTLPPASTLLSLLSPSTHTSGHSSVLHISQDGLRRQAAPACLVCRALSFRLLLGVTDSEAGGCPGWTTGEAALLLRQLGYRETSDAVTQPWRTPQIFPKLSPPALTLWKGQCLKNQKTALDRW